MKYKSPSASALPPPSVDGSLAAIWYLSPKLFTEDILAEALLILAMFVEQVLIAVMLADVAKSFISLITSATANKAISAITSDVANKFISATTSVVPSIAISATTSAVPSIPISVMTAASPSKPISVALAATAPISLASFATATMSLILVCTVCTWVMLLWTVCTCVALAATVVTSVAFGTSLWNAYVCRVEVVSTNTPKPAARTVDPQPVMVIVALFETLPLAIVTLPLDGVLLLPISLILTIVPPVAGLFISGLVSGKTVSLAIGTKPPTSSTRSIILASIAAVVATLSSALLQVSPDWISSAVFLP